ncbi:MAG: glycoside hydrolase domain-containing protein, partial [Candidatus Binataceae bacterium]
MKMQTWWNDSPYFDAGFYVAGAADYNVGGNHADPGLDATWVQAVSGQGWDLAPIWVGEQAPCTNFQTTFDWDPTVASNEGAIEAGVAAAAVGATASGGYGLQNTIIYFDMEHCEAGATNPNNRSQTCGAAVVAFLTGWVNGIQSAHYK